MPPACGVWSLTAWMSPLANLFVHAARRPPPTGAKELNAPGAPPRPFCFAGWQTLPATAGAVSG